MAAKDEENGTSEGLLGQQPSGFTLRVLVIRHGIAEERKAGTGPGKPDAQRVLTRSGRKRMRRNAKGLARLVPHLDALASSPLVRAIETGQIVADRFACPPHPVRVGGLAPGKPVGLVLDWLKEQAQRRPGAVVAIVGHEPHLGEFISWALTGLRESFMTLKKGSACMLEFRQEIKPARAKLHWVLKPSQLREIARK